MAPDDTIAITIAEETPLSDDMRALIAELNAAMDEMEPETPEDFNFRLSVEEMAGPETTVFVARRDDRAIGCCALRRHDGGLAEVKRMYVRPAARGLSVGARLLSALEAKAAGEGISRLALETGHAFHAAHRVYERAGFERCAAFADYPDSPFAFFYDKALGWASAARADISTEARP